MLTQYIEAAMGQVLIEYDEEDQMYYGEIPACRDVIGVGQTSEECRRDTREALEAWIPFRVHSHLSLPAIDGIDLNAVKETA